jgi:hypothetical protein
MSAARGALLVAMLGTLKAGEVGISATNALSTQ